MKRIGKVIIIFLCVLTFTPLFSLAQGTLIEYGMQGIPQSAAQNPAFRPNASLVIGLPVMSSVYAGVYNTAFSFDDIFVTDNQNDSLYFDLSKPASSKVDLNYFRENLTVDLLSVGFNIDKTFLTIGVRNRLSSRLYYTTDLLRFLWNGNANYVGENLDLSGSGIYEEHLNEYYLGLSFPVSNSIDMGFRVNFLQGLSNINTSASQLTLLTNTNNQSGFDFVAQTDFNIETSEIANLISDSIEFSPTDYLLSFHNVGFSLDAGVNVRFGDQFTLQASVVDLGRIYWYGNPKSYSSEEKEITFDGIEYDFNADNGDDAFTTYLDSLGSLLHVNESNEIYSTSMRAKVFLNGQYCSLNKKNRINLLFAGRFLEESFEYALSFGYTYAPSDKFALKLNYSYLKYAPLNVGLCFYFTFKPFQIYVATDNVMSFFKWSAQKYGNFHFGINILIPSHSKIKGEIPVEHEKENGVVE